jgi:hypothetical protein
VIAPPVAPSKPYLEIASDAVWTNPHPLFALQWVAVQNPSRDAIVANGTRLASALLIPLTTCAVTAFLAINIAKPGMIVGSGPRGHYGMCVAAKVACGITDLHPLGDTCHMREFLLANRHRPHDITLSSAD